MQYNTLEEMLCTLGKAKRNEETEMTWAEVADEINDAFGTSHSGEWCRKRYDRLSNILEYQPPLSMDPDIDTRIKVGIQELEKQRIRTRAEHKKYRTLLKTELTLDALADDMLEYIHNLPSTENKCENACEHAIEQDKNDFKMRATVMEANDYNSMTIENKNQEKGLE